MRRAAALLLLVACSDPITKERVTRDPVTEKNPLVVDRRGMIVHEHGPPPLPDQCELGERGGCGSPIERHARYGPFATCVRMPDGSLRWSRATCNTPLVVAWNDAPVTFTRPQGEFAIGVSSRTEWVSAESPWLAADDDGSGCIESAAELFAGFAPLAARDDDGNGRIDESDRVFSQLVLWADRDQDRHCTPDEISPLAARGIVAVDLHPTPPPRLVFGSFEGDRAAASTTFGRARVVDVYLAPF